MVDENKISRVGNGMYRMSIDNDNHYETLLYSIDNGYNLIDTSTNYLNGESEELVGKVIKNNPHLSHNIFVISKVGYLTDTTEEIKTFLNDKKGMNQAVIENDIYHCIHPRYISYQLEKSLERLNRDYIDCYLIHNPERYFKSTNINTKELIYKLLKESFELLEKKVKEGKIRSYGISSNKITNPSLPDHLDLKKIIELCSSIKKDHSFKFLQFPFNFLEKQALEPNYNGSSLIEFANNNNIKTIANRPFSMDENGFDFRLRSYKNCIQKDEDETFSLFYETIDKQIREVTENENSANDFEFIEILKNDWKTFNANENVFVFWRDYMDPFIETIYPSLPKKVSDLIENIKSNMFSNVKKNVTNKAEKFIDSLEQKGLKKEKNTALTALGNYFNEGGLDHVLIGLRQKQYIDDLEGTYVK